MADTGSKPAGGIRAATIFPVGEGVALPVTLVEGRSSYSEEVLCDDGILRIHHTLTLVAPRTEAASLLAMAPQMAFNGVTAEIETEAGETLTAGYTDRFVHEQPLRLTSLGMDSGTRPVEGNAVVLRLESDDTTALQKPFDPSL